MYLFDSITISPTTVNMGTLLGRQVKPKLTINGLNTIQSLGEEFDEVNNYAYILRFELSRSNPAALIAAVNLILAQNRLVWAQPDSATSGNPVSSPPYPGKVMASEVEHAGGIDLSPYIDTATQPTYYDVTDLFSQSTYNYLVDLTAIPNDYIYVYRLITRVRDKVEAGRYIVGLNSFDIQGMNGFLNTTPIRGLASDKMVTGSLDRMVVVPPIRPRFMGKIEAHKTNAFTMSAARNEELIKAFSARILGGAIGAVDAMERMLLNLVGRLQYETRSTDVATLGLLAMSVEIG